MLLPARRRLVLKLPLRGLGSSGEARARLDFQSAHPAGIVDHRS